jgi:hypothetical protein
MFRAGGMTLRASPPLPTPRGEPRFGVDRGSIASDEKSEKRKLLRLLTGGLIVESGAAAAVYAPS